MRFWLPQAEAMQYNLSWMHEVADLTLAPTRA